jgi:putative DNA primase/helicase
MHNHTLDAYPKQLALDNGHLDELRGSGLTDATIQAAGLHSADGDEIADILGWQEKAGPWGRGWVIPYRQNGDAEPALCRVKLDHPRHDKAGDPIKYEAPLRAPIRVYFPPGVCDALRDPGTPIMLTEGEKKALAAAQCGFACIAIPGVWTFGTKRARRQTGKATGPRLLIEDLDTIAWNGRQVYVVFDSDAADKPEVRAAENTLAEILQGRGATVRVVRLPKFGDGKVGLDDFLVHHGVDGPARLRELMEQSPEATPEKSGNTNPMPLADAYISDHLMHSGGPKARHWRDELHVWDGQRYRPVATGDFAKRALTWLDTKVDGARPRLAADIVECIAARLLIAAHHEQPLWLGDPKDGPAEAGDWVAVNNGILDLRRLAAGESGVVRPHTPLWFSPHVLPYGYDPSATCPAWFQFLDDTLDGDEERVNLLAEWFGYCLTPDTRHQSIMFLEGPRRSGKGTTLRVLRRLVGEHNVVAPRLSTLGEMFGLQSLIGKSVALCPDAHLGSGDRAMNIMEVLKSISGEDALEVHRKHLPSLSNVRLGVRFTLAVNELPKFGDSANTLMSRLLILPYRNDYSGREDRDLESRLAGELGGIFNWALYGLQRLRESGRFTVPAASQQVASDFERLTSPVKAFLDDTCLIAATAQCDRGDLWRGWVAWCEAKGHKAGSEDRFGNRLRLLVPAIGRAQPRQDGRRLNLYTGIGLLAVGTSGTSETLL